jgi:hypothetical protein
MRINANIFDMIIGSVFEAYYKGHKLTARKRLDLGDLPWESLVEHSGMPEGNVVDPLGPVVPQLHPTVEQAKKAACQMVTMIADEDGIGKGCEQAGIVWKEVIS